eukprot:GHVT01086862.1.p1 GENE.GHVT01086862.1~~GHVT01086862.1.p1  ORF type:complete len:337 (+),score=76.06 GHVT01086862.1:238-1248(+)
MADNEDAGAPTDALHPTTRHDQAMPAERSSVGGPLKQEESSLKHGIFDIYKEDDEDAKEELREEDQLPDDARHDGPPLQFPTYDELLRDEAADEAAEEGGEEPQNEVDLSGFDDAFASFISEVDSLPKLGPAGMGMKRREIAASHSTVKSLGTPENQVLRLTAQFFASPYQVLLIGPDAETAEIKKQYRKISLLIHPDKCSHPKAHEAFQILTKAYEQMGRPEMREKYRGVLAEAKKKVMKERLKENKLKKSKGEALLAEDEKDMQAEISEMCETILKDQDERRTYAETTRQANERWEKEQLEKVAAAEEEERQKRKQFRATQEDRVGGWRNFKVG